MLSIVAPVIIFQHNPFAVFRIVPSRRRPVSFVSGDDLGLTHKGVIRGGIGHTCHVPTYTRVSLPVSNDVQNHEILWRASNQCKTVISVG